MPGDQSSRMLAVLLGASTFPNAPKLAEGRAFYISAADVKEYLWDQQGLALPRRNTLSLFDDSRSPSDQLMEVANFLVRRTLELKNEGARPEDLLIYYVGHGLFTRSDQAYCLAVRSTNELNEGATSIRAGDLAGVVKENAAFLRRYIILDCCFAASIHKEFQSGALGAARVQMANEFPARGTALLCSSNAHEASLAPQGLEHTMFSDALIRSLRGGHPSCGPRMSFSELGDLIQENLRSEYPERWVRPEVHSPDQREGDIAHLPLFPNPAYRQLEAVHERMAAENAAAELAAQKEAGRIAREKAEAERAARQKAEQDRVARQRAEAGRIAAEAEAERIAAQEEAEQVWLTRQKAEAERIAAEAEAERIAAQQKAAQDRVARQESEAERMAAEAEAERIAARQKAEQDRLTRQKSEAERMAAEAEAERIAAQRKAEQDRLTRQKAEAERIAAEAEAERAAAHEKAEQDRLARRKAEAERSAREKAYLEKTAFLKAEGERAAAQEKAGQERLAQKAEADRIAAEKAQGERAGAQEKAEEDRLARQKSEAERMAQAAVAERAAAEEKATQERLAQSPAPAKAAYGGKLLVVVVMLVIAIWAWNHSAPQRTPPAENSQPSDSSGAAPKPEKPSSSPAVTPPSGSAPAETVGAHFSMGGPADAPTVLDARTGLMWTRKDYWAVEGKFAAAWDDAMQWARKMNAAAYAGYSDWSVPTIAQYRTINRSQADRDEDARTFEKTDGTTFWSSNTPNQNVASYISFTEGYAVSGSRTDPMYRNGMGQKAAPMSVRLVRTK